MNRKDDHIQFAYAQPTKTNDFDLIKLDDFETKAGREGILTFVFIKR